MLLTVLCIVSTIMGVWNIAGGISNAFTGNAERELSQARIQLENSVSELNKAGAKSVAGIMESALVMAERTAQQAKPLGYSTMAIAVVGLVGVWFMWRLRRIGFWVYVSACVVGLVVPVVLIGGGIVSMMAVGFSSLFVVVFIVLYATQLKYMR